MASAARTISYVAAAAVSFAVLGLVAANLAVDNLTSNLLAVEAAQIGRLERAGVDICGGGKGGWICEPGEAPPGRPHYRPEGWPVWRLPADGGGHRWVLLYAPAGGGDVQWMELPAVARAVGRTTTTLYTLMAIWGVLGALLWYAAGRLPERRRVVALERSLERFGHGGEREIARSRDPLALALHQTIVRLHAAQTDLVQAERLATLGYFAGGLAHQIGNPLSAARQYLEALAAQLDGADDRTAETLARVRRQIDRIHRAVEGLLRFARPERLVREPVPVAPFAARIAADLEALWGEGAAIAVDVPADLEVRTDALALEQILLNVVRNALEARPEHPEVSIAAARTSDGMVAITVRDRGPGFPDSAGAQVPLGSAKPGGTGLGLPLAMRLAELLGGRLEWANREPGAEVTVTLPAAEPGSTPNGNPAPAPAS